MSTRSSALESLCLAFYKDRGGIPYTDGSVSCFNALMGSTGSAGPVCEGYARAFKVLCDAAGIPCVLSKGLADGVYGHMWNVAEVQGDWYAVDVTWDDPGYGGAANSGCERSSYLLVGSGTVVEGRPFGVSHVAVNDFNESGIGFPNEPVMAVGAYDRSNSPSQIDVSGANIEVDGATYTGQPLLPAVTVTLGGATLRPDIDYFVTYSNNVNAGRGSVTVTGMEGYTGTKVATFPIAKAAPAISVPAPIALDFEEGTRDVAVDGTEGRPLNVTSSDTGVVTVSANGAALSLTPVSMGSVTITVTVQGDANNEAIEANVSVHVDETVKVWRLYCVASGEHLFTTDANEYCVLSSRPDWQGEGIAWRSPATGSPVWRLYHSASGKHFYTADANERLSLLKSDPDWRDEGICWRSDIRSRMAVYRLHNPLAPFASAHHFTAASNEYAALGRMGWSQEGTCWYAVGE